MPVIALGVDGGGTRTRCAVSVGGTIVGRGVSSGCNIVRVGEAVARESIHAAIRQAIHAAQLEFESVDAACLGVAGNDVPQVHEAVQRIVGELLRCPVRVVGDQEIAFESAFGASAGILVISGTGSIAFGRNRYGKTARAGGHGFVISDEGSGQWIGRKAVSACLRALDAGTDCGLMPILLREFRVSTPGELIQAANAMPLPDFSSLLPVVLETAQGGDLIALEVLRQAGDQLAFLAKLIAARLGMQRQDFRVAMTGGVFEHCAVVREEFERALRRSHPEASVIGVVAEPLLGALSLAANDVLQLGTRRDASPKSAGFASECATQK